MKRKIIIIISIIVTTFFVIGIAYSAFQSDATLNVADQKIAKFIFNTKVQDQIELPLTNLEPNSKQEYSFSVTNSQENKISNVTINYQIAIKTFHFIPLEIKLYKDQEEEAILTCDESFSRDEDNILVCNSPIQELNHNQKKQDDFKLEVIFPEKYNTEEYANLVDFVDIEIKSWQKKVK